MARVANPGRRSFTLTARSLSPRGGHLAFERRHGQRAQSQQAVVEPGQGERTVFAFGRLPTPSHDLELADLVGAGLARPGDVPVDLDLGVQARGPRRDHPLPGT